MHTFLCMWVHIYFFFIGSNSTCLKKDLKHFNLRLHLVFFINILSQYKRICFLDGESHFYFQSTIIFVLLFITANWANVFVSHIVVWTVEEEPRIGTGDFCPVVFIWFYFHTLLRLIHTVEVLARLHGLVIDELFSSDEIHRCFQCSRNVKSLVLLVLVPWRLHWTVSVSLFLYYIGKEEKPFSHPLPHLLPQNCHDVKKKKKNSRKYASSITKILTLSHMVHSLSISSSYASITPSLVASLMTNLIQ